MACSFERIPESSEVDMLLDLSDGGTVVGDVSKSLTKSYPAKRAQCHAEASA